MTETSSYIPVSSSDLDVLKQYIKREFHVTKFKEECEISPDITWRPTLQITVNHHTTIAFELNEKVYPPIIALNRMGIVNTNQPICVYSVCHEEEYVRNMSEFRRLQSEGIGLITINDSGNVTRHNYAIPLAQFIPKRKFEDLIKGIPASIKQRVKVAFDTYNQNPIGGLEEITKIIEGLTYDTARKLVTAGKLDSYRSNISLSNLLGKMANKATENNSELTGQKAVIGGFQSHVKTFRNASHHAPSSKKQAKKLLADCEGGFTEGIRKINAFVTSFKKIGITPKLNS
ncbi:MAG: hypothetical protein AB2689_28880 [Candidatus Thiodiazotropha taylori]